MGQKTHPYGFRLGVIKTWTSKWYEDKQYTQWLHEDLRIKRAVKDFLYNANIAGVEVERAANKAKVIVFTARPGMVIGKGGKGIETLKSGNLKTAAKGETKFPGVQSFTSNEVFIDVQEVRKPETNAQLVAENIATQLERRVAFRRAMKKALATSIKFGAKGVRIRCSGRLGGAEMSRVETYREGRVPLHTLRADIEFGLAEAHTTYGIIGVKVWMFKGEVLQRKARRIPGALERRPTNHAFSQANQVPEAAEGQQPRHRAARQRRFLRRLRSPGPRVRPDDLAADRGGSYGDHSPREARWQALDPRVPRPAGHQEAPRSPHGRGQGFRGAVGG